VKATQQDGSYPRPMMCRDNWTSLDGSWAFAHDDADDGLTERWFEATAAEPFDREIQVPFPPESPASGIADKGFHPVVWYRLVVPHDALIPVPIESGRVLLHFGAVDYRAKVWFDGQLVASHIGGQTPFTADVTDTLSAADEHVIVVRAEDDPNDFEQPRGKQDWREKTHGIWYERTTGIWQSVWTEVVPADHIADVAWTPDVAAGTVHAEVTLARCPRRPMRLELTFSLGDEVLAAQSVLATSRSVTIDVGFDALRNGQDRARLLWTPENPVLVDVHVVVHDVSTGAPVDAIASYLGVRTAAVGGGSFRLNDQPYYLRSVLNQGYRRETHLATRGSIELRTEVELTKAMGFNAVRIHQKAEDPRFLFWADRLGLLLWAETAAAYEFSSTAVQRLTSEWLDLVRRDRSHPCVVAWVPINESWGVQDIAVNTAQQHYARALADLTRALDPSRPVISNEGWEHVNSDILGLHDYTTDPEVLRARYGTRPAVHEIALSALGPQGHRPMLTDTQRQSFLAGDAPFMITEFGGISLSDSDEAWGYGHVGSDSEYASLLQGLFEALRASSAVTGFCYTQFMDTGQETNGLLYEDGTPKLPIEVLHQIVTGVKDGRDVAPSSTFGWTG
jgi:beta-galactosidase/beta-glucuronidase